MSRFTDFIDAQRSGAVVVDHRIELRTKGGKVLATTKETEATGDRIHWGAMVGSLAVESNRASQRTVAMDLPVTNPLLVSDHKPDLLHPDTGNRVRVEMGVRVAGVMTYRPKATLVVNSADTTFESGAGRVDVSLVDTTKPLVSNLTSLFKFSDGESVLSVVQRLCSQVMDDGDFEISDTGFLTPGGSFEAGEERLSLVRELLAGVGQELVTRPGGKVYSRPVLPTDDSEVTERWRYGQSDGIPVHRYKRVTNSRSPQAVRVEAGSLRSVGDSITLTVYDTDPTSQDFFDGEGDVDVATVRLPFVDSKAQAAVAGYGVMAKTGTGPAIIEFESITNPFLAEGDLIDLFLEEISVDAAFRVTDYRIDPHLRSRMWIRCRQTYDPAVNFTLPTEPNAGCLVGFVGDFTVDGNLEHLPPLQPGSPDWTEYGWSWGVEQLLFVQRYDGGWSFGIVNTPICSSNVTVTVTIARMPLGRFAGPLARSTGTDNGYAALMDSSGRVSLEYWLNRQRVAVLGSHDSGEGPVGKQLALTANGQQLTVALDGQQIISASDGRSGASYVGVLGLGKASPDSPALSTFDVVAT